MNKINKKLVFALFLTVALLGNISAQEKTEQATDKTAAVIKMDQLLTILNSTYVEEVNNEEMMENAIVGLLKELDPHSVYIPEKELKRMNEPLEGNFEGIGIQFNILKDTLLVVSPISGGPSEKLGIRSGDKIINIEGELVAGIGLKNSDVTKKLRGKKGTKVTVDILRKGEKKLIPYEIVRDKIPIYSIDAAYMAEPDVAYIKINRFARTTMEEYKKAIDSLQGKGAENLILDLRGNGGGYLNTAFQLADEFLDEGKLIVYTQGDKQRKREYKSRPGGGFEKGKLIVLIDEGSASASEIVSGAIQDWDRGMIIGRRSFGKGLVQKSFPLSDGSAVRITTAKYYTPTGRSIQRPYDQGKDKYYKEINRRFEHGELMEKDSIVFPDSLKFYTPNKRIVYGGGGIMPDIFIPLDTSMNSELNRKLIRKGIYNEFTLTYLDTKRDDLLKAYPTIGAFISKFELGEDLMRDFFEYAEKKDIKKDDDDYLKSKKLIDTQLMALIARNLYDVSSYFEIINQLNDSYLEALNVIHSDEFEKANLVYE